MQSSWIHQSTDIISVISIIWWSGWPKNGTLDAQIQTLLKIVLLPGSDKNMWKKVLLNEGKTRPNYDTFSSKEVESHLEGGQNILAVKRRHLMPPPKEVSKTRDVWPCAAIAALAGGGRVGEKAANAFFELPVWPMLAWRPKYAVL